ncbi:MAG: TerB family tellurite resistance protein [Alphaproteobacteria bacterium]|nr:TerB family tellurite resistance protein [Alphaproteobacteria bacterium]
MARFWGKVMGGTLGLAIGGGPLGALIGMAIGHAYDKRVAEIGGDSAWFGTVAGHGARERAREDAKNLAYLTAVTTLGAKLAKIDGRVTHAEIEAFKRAFPVYKTQEKRVAQLFDNARRDALGYEAYAYQLAHYFNAQPSVLEDVLYGLATVAAADGAHLNPSESRFIRTTAYIFGMAPDRLQTVMMRAGALLSTADGSSGRDRANGAAPPVDKTAAACTILGVKTDATAEEIKTTYRTLIRQNHPDKLAASGATPDMLVAATEKMKNINAAYDTLCKIKGIK